MNKTKITPPELAAKWGISAEKVLSWINAGELRAIDASTSRNGRPRYLIDLDDVAAFEQSRTSVKAKPVIKAKRPRRTVKRYV